MSKILEAELINSLESYKTNLNTALAREQQKDVKIQQLQKNLLTEIESSRMLEHLTACGEKQTQAAQPVSALIVSPNKQRLDELLIKRTEFVTDLTITDGKQIITAKFTNTIKILDLALTNGIKLEDYQISIPSFIAHLENNYPNPLNTN